MLNFFDLDRAFVPKPMLDWAKSARAMLPCCNSRSAEGNCVFSSFKIVFWWIWAHQKLWDGRPGRWIFSLRLTETIIFNFALRRLSCLNPRKIGTPSAAPSSGLKSKGISVEEPLSPTVIGAPEVLL